jgi:hypothetical protein
MQYINLALSLAWPQMVVAVLWLGAGLAALWYARATRRPIFLFGAITSLLLALSEVLSPLRLAYRYVTHRVDCASTSGCATELQFGAAKYEWILVGLAALVLLAGFYREVARARRRAAANRAARAVAQQPAMAAAPAPFAGYSPAAAAAQPITGYDAALPDEDDSAFSAEFADPALTLDLAPPAEPEEPTFYRRPAAGSGSGPF